MTRLLEEVGYPSVVDIRTEFTRLLTDIETEMSDVIDERGGHARPLYEMLAYHLGLDGESGPRGNLSAFVDDILRRYATGPALQVNRKAEFTPRNVLKRVVAAYDKLGLKPVVAPEIEFYLVRKNPDPDYQLVPPVY